MKYCEQVLLYAQDELNSEEKQAFEKHLAACPACQEEVAFLKKIDEGFVIPATPAQVVDKLFARTTRKKSVWARFNKLAWTACGALAVATGVFLLTFSAEPQAFNARELVAYMDYGRDSVATLGSDWASIQQEMADLENYF